MIVFDKETYQKFKGLKLYDGLIEDVTPYEGGGKFCDESIVIYIKINYEGSKIDHVLYTGELSAISRSCMNYLISEVGTSSTEKLLEIDPEEFLKGSFVPTHRAKQLLFSLIHFQNAVKEKIGREDYSSLEAVLGNLDII